MVIHCDTSLFQAPLRLSGTGPIVLVSEVVRTRVYVCVCVCVCVCMCVCVCRYSSVGQYLRGIREFPLYMTQCGSLLGALSHD